MQTAVPEQIDLLAHEPVQRTGTLTAAQYQQQWRVLCEAVLAQKFRRPRFDRSAFRFRPRPHDRSDDTMPGIGPVPGIIGPRSTRDGSVEGVTHACRERREQLGRATEDRV
ncbi:MAG: hypothetical protein ACYTFV_14065, partial [Planctomycetota bacterium]